uniref:Uncharacterized protein n=1 Tax=Crocodylus porosus TaxID=8502 RepID=A0A7M4ETY6_CROPO
MRAPKQRDLCAHLLQTFLSPLCTVQIRGEGGQAREGAKQAGWEQAGTSPSWQGEEEESQQLCKLLPAPAGGGGQPGQAACCQGVQDENGLALPVVSLSLLMYPVLKSLALQVHSAVTGSYTSGAHSIAFINCPNEQIAKDIARAIMDKKLAACMEPVSATGMINHMGGGVFCFRSVHPFEIPEFISLPIDQGNPLYLKWIEEELKASCSTVLPPLESIQGSH